MYKFPKNLYTDVRIENVFESTINYTDGVLDENKVREYTGAFIRVFDGQRWYYKSTTDVENIQDNIDELSTMAQENHNILENPIVKKFQVNKDEIRNYEGYEINSVSQNEKLALVNDLLPLIKEKEEVKSWKVNYKDKRVEKEFYSSKGSSIKHDYQAAGVGFFYSVSFGDKKFDDNSRVTSKKFEDLKELINKFDNDYNETVEFVKNSKSVEPGKYTVVLSPVVAGVFAHESFGHKSEADSMIGDETMMKEWKIGTKVGSDILSIVDYGENSVSGYVPYDDEGTKTEKTYLIKNGVLSGRLHSASTASDLQEELTGNGRAKDFEFEPIVRMTNTYIEPGDKTKDELIGEVKEGIYIEDYKHGSGLSTFTIAPKKAYMIREGKIAEPVNISVISGNVMETLFKIDGASDELKINDNVWGGCGKMEQTGLSRAHGGPYVRVRDIQVQ
ncbi:TldD/PmbA family protein [Oceanirhabdus sp. W0125-5]|uniref:TldD/PmbA family protein n=1 Tax=Oceanirhabdus sp. W0125-5 TaxID=2999116 RepID=UPI0022F31E5F|nr:TldD/PmbA family protein [Oceanirhabdus sp. W0125-5]WBW99046.1 TldD/PmbA family protein [Oceanirhabdus sp. W0125-5]